MSISINYSSTIGLHGVDPVITSKHLIEWITSYNDITVTGKTNFNNDIQLSYDSLNFLNINIDENANTIFNITNVGNNNNLSTFIYNNKIQANNGISIKGDTIIGDSIDNSLFINSNIYINNNTIFNDVFFKDNIRIGGNLHITGTMNNPAISTNDITILGSNTNIGLTIDNTDTSNNSIINFKNNGNTIYSIGYSGSNQVFQICNSDFDSQPRITINSSGNVGIGTTNPSSKLHVNGTTNITGATNIGGTLDVTGATNIHNSTVSNKVVENNVDLLIEDDNSRLQLISTDIGGGGSYIALSNALATPITTPSLTIHQKNWVFHHSGPSQDNKLGIYYRENGEDPNNNNISTESLYILSTTGLTLDTSGNVGIGTSNPEDKLHVSGDIRLTGEIYFDYPRIFTLGSRDATGGGSATKLVLQAKTNGKEFQMRNQDDLSCFAFAMYNHDELPSPSGSSIFDVYSAKDVVSRIGYAFIGYPGVTGSAGFGHINMFGNDQKYALRQTGLGATVLNSYNNDLFFRINNSDKMLIDTSGNVGIGTTNPGAPLHIYNSTSSNSLAIDNTNTGTTGRTSILFRPDGNNWELGARNSNSGDLTNKFYLYDINSSATRLLVDSSGNVGIGETDPDEKLEVYPNANESAIIGKAHIGWVGWDNHAGFSHLNINGANSYALLQSTTGNTYLNAPSNNNVHFRINNQDKMFLSGATATLGNFGIGTTNPTEKLEVNGNIKGTNFIGNVDGTLDNYDSTRFFRREGRTNAGDDGVGPGWISVATCTNAGSTQGRYAGEILVTDNEGGDHTYIRIHWMRSFNDSNFTVINCGGHSNRITGARVLYQTSNNTYGEKILQVKVTATSNYYVSVFRMGDDPNYGTFTALTPVVEDTKTGFAVHGNELTDLHYYGFAHEEGIQAGGNIKAGGDLHVDGNTYYGSSTRQMINLYSDDYGIGVQGNTTYFRSSNDFQFYKGGSHHDGEGNAGGGTTLLTIKRTGNVGIGTDNPSTKLHVNGDSRIDGTISYGSTNKTASLYIKGTGLNNAASRLVILSGQTIVNTGSGYTGLTLTIINGQNLQHISSTNYDTYNSTTNSDNLATAINNMTHTQIGILTSYDSFTRYITSDLRTAAMRVGLTKLARVASNGETNYTSREPYAAIFYGTSSDGDSTPQYIRDVIEIYRNNEDYDGTNFDESPPAIISTTLSSDGNYAGIAGASSVNALWTASPGIENPALICDNTGNVGIGTTSPSSRLHIEDSTSAVAFTINNTISSNDSIINFNNLGSTQYSMGYDSSLNTFQICDGNFSNSSIFRINSNKITVGSSNTSYDINNFNISGSFYFAKQGSNFDYSNNNFGGTGPNIRIGDYMYLGHTRANNFPYIAFNGYLSSSTYVSGGTTYNRWQHKYHNGTDSKITLITANISGSISIKTANTTGNEIEENGYATTSNFTNIVHIGNTGNVGIGTTNPSSKLHIYNSTVSNKVVEDNVDLLIEDAEARLQIISTDSGGGGSLIALSNAPSSGSQKNWVFHHNGPSVDNKLGIYYKPNTGTDSLWQISNIGLTLDTLGNVGIGTSSPTRKLDVIGDIRSGGTHYMLWNTNTGGTGSLNGGSSYGRVFVHSRVNTTQTTKANSLLVINYGGDFGSGTKIDGNVGIGTTPSSGLHVYRNTGSGVQHLILENGQDSDNNIYMISFKTPQTSSGSQANQCGIGVITNANSRQIWSDSRYSMTHHIENTSEWVIKTSGWINLFGIKPNDRVYIKDKLGIGTTDPDEKLEVDGNVNITGLLKINNLNFCKIIYIGSTVISDYQSGSGSASHTRVLSTSYTDGNYSFAPADHFNPDPSNYTIGYYLSSNLWTTGSNDVVYYYNGTELIRGRSWAGSTTMFRNQVESGIWHSWYQFPTQSAYDYSNAGSTFTTYSANSFNYVNVTIHTVLIHKSYMDYPKVPNISSTYDTANYRYSNNAGTTYYNMFS